MSQEPNDINMSSGDDTTVPPMASVGTLSSDAHVDSPLVQAIYNTLANYHLTVQKTEKELLEKIKNLEDGQVKTHNGLEQVRDEVRQGREVIKDVVLEITENLNPMLQQPGTSVDHFSCVVGAIDLSNASNTTLASVIEKVCGNTPQKEFTTLQKLCSHMRGAWFNMAKSKIYFQFDCLDHLDRLRASQDLQVELIHALGLQDTTPKKEYYWIVLKANHTDENALKSGNRDRTIKEWSKQLGLDIQDAQKRMNKLYIKLPNATQGLRACRNLLPFDNGYRVARPVDMRAIPHFCRSCGKPGHMEHDKECDLKTKRLNINCCLICSEPGHYKQDCPYKKSPHRYKCLNCHEAHRTEDSSCKNPEVKRHRKKCDLLEQKGAWWSRGKILANDYPDLPESCGNLVKKNAGRDRPSVKDVRRNVAGPSNQNGAPGSSRGLPLDLSGELPGSSQQSGSTPAPARQAQSSSVYSRPQPPGMRGLQASGIDYLSYIGVDSPQSEAPQVSPTNNAFTKLLQARQSAAAKNTGVGQSGVGEEGNERAEEEGNETAAEEGNERAEEESNERAEEEGNERASRKRTREANTGPRQLSKRSKSASKNASTNDRIELSGPLHLPIKCILRATQSSIDQPAPGQPKDREQPQAVEQSESGQPKDREQPQAVEQSESGQPKDSNQPRAVDEQSASKQPASGHPEDPSYKQFETWFLVSYFDAWSPKKRVKHSWVHEKDVPKDQWRAIKRWIETKPLITEKFRTEYVDRCVAKYGHIEQSIVRQYPPASAAEVGLEVDANPQAAPDASGTPSPAMTAGSEPRPLDAAGPIDTEVETEATTRHRMPLPLRSSQAPDVPPTPPPAKTAESEPCSLDAAGAFDPTVSEPCSLDAAGSFDPTVAAARTDDINWMPTHLMTHRPNHSSQAPVASLTPSVPIAGPEALSSGFTFSLPEALPSEPVDSTVPLSLNIPPSLSEDL